MLGAGIKKMTQPKNLRYFNESEKSEAIAQITRFINDNFDLPEGESAEEIASDAVGEAVKEKVVDLFNQKAMIESLVSKSKKNLQEWV